MKYNRTEIRLQGQGLSPGIAIGTCFFFTSQEDLTPNAPLPALSVRQVPGEINRYRAALEQSRLDLRHLRERLESDHVPDGVDILDAQLQMMEDPLITEEVEVDISAARHNAETAFCQVIQRCEQRFRSLADPDVWERYRDIQDVAKRVLRYLRSQERPSLADISKESVVFADDLAASDAAEALEGAVAAFVTEQGGITSHAAIVARAGNIPYVTHIDLSQLNDIPSETPVIVDGHSGIVILAPTPSTLAHYRQLRRNAKERDEGLQEIGRLKPETWDGHAVRLSANLEIDSDLDALHHYGSSGVGLFRSEYMMMTHDEFPSEAEQFICYRRIVRQMRGLPVTIRVFDVGGDKALGSAEWGRELNPYLGWRAIRFLLREPQIFRVQLRAILRASAYGDVGIMFPLITGLQELLTAKQFVEETRQQLISEGFVFERNVRIGCMIEVPSAAIVTDLLAKECDFLSIGTNDLVQYSLAVDRGNPGLSGHYTPTHPGIVRLIRLIVTEANRWNVPVAVCGEIAADPRYTALLLGLGVHELSVSPRRIPLIKRTIRRLSMVWAMELADHVLGLSTAEEILEVLDREYQRLFPEDAPGAIACAEEPVSYT
jgi:phosphotransferase system enzyme I (PtsI)